MPGPAHNAGLPRNLCPTRHPRDDRAQVEELASTAATAARLADPRTHFIVAESDGHLIGFAELRFGDAPAPLPSGPAARSGPPVRPRSALPGEAWARGCSRRPRLAAAGGARAVWLTAWVGNARAGLLSAPGYDTAGTMPYRFQDETYENRRFARAVAPPPPCADGADPLRHINPDHFLDTPQGRDTTPEATRSPGRSAAPLDATLRGAAPNARLYLMVGAQGSGKSRWARRRAAAEPGAIVFDAILVQPSSGRRCSRPRRSRRCGCRRLVPHAASRPAWRATRPAGRRGGRRAGSAQRLRRAAAPALDEGFRVRHRRRR